MVKAGGELPLHRVLILHFSSAVRCSISRRPTVREAIRLSEDRAWRIGLQGDAMTVRVYG